MKLRRVIYRIDFPRNFEMINTPGTIAKLLSEFAPPSFFDEDGLGEDRNKRKMIARRLSKDPASYYSIGVEPVTIAIDMESLAGIEISDLSGNAEFRGLCDLTSGILKHYKITQFDRAGIRFFFIDKVMPKGVDPLGVFKTLFQSPLLSAAEQMLGKSFDIGLSIDGRSDSDVAYHFRTGPFRGKEEYGKYFATISDSLPDNPDWDCVIDLDVFELKFAYTAASAAKWTVPQIRLAEMISEELTKFVKGVAK